MNRIFLFSVLLLATTSCLTNSKISRNCDRFLQVCGTPTETQTWIEYRDTVVSIPSIPVKLPNSNIHVSLVVKQGENNAAVSTNTSIPDGYSLIKQGEYSYKQGINTVIVAVDADSLRVDVIAKDSTTVQPDPIRLEDAIIEKKEKQATVVRETYIPWPYKWSLRIVIVSILIALGLLYQKISGKNLIQMILTLFKKVI